MNERYNDYVEKLIQRHIVSIVKIQCMRDHLFITDEEMNNLNSIFCNDMDLGEVMINNLYKEYEEEIKNKESK